MGGAFFTGGQAMSCVPNGPAGPRIQDGAIKNADDFWQLVQDVAYIIEGENRDFEREYMHWLDACLEKYLTENPEIKFERGVECPLEHFAMLSVRRLVHAFVFNDGGNKLSKPSMAEPAKEWEVWWA